MSHVSPRSITLLSGSIRLWKTSAPRNLVSSSEFSTTASLNIGKRALRPVCDSEFEADRTLPIRINPKPSSPSPPSIKIGLAECLRSKGYTIDESLPPLAFLKYARKSGLLEIGIEDALGVIRRYVLLAGTKEGIWETEFCAEENIQPATLTFLSILQSRCIEPPRKLVAKSLMFSATKLLDPTATIMITEEVLKGIATHATEKIQILSALEILAKKKHNPAAMVLLGRVYESERKDDAALDIYRQAYTTPLPDGPPLPTSFVADIERDPAREALLYEGRLQLRRNSLGDARAAFQKAALQHDSAIALHQLALLDGPTSPSYEQYLLKAAMAGTSDASYDLGAFYASRANDVTGHQTAGNENGRLSEKERVWNRDMAKEWLAVSATAGNAASRTLLRGLLEREGPVDPMAWPAAVEAPQEEDVGKRPAAKKTRGTRSGVRKR